MKSEDRSSIVEKHLGFALTDEEKATINNEQSKEVRDHARNVLRVIDARTNTGWTTSGHTAVDVQIFAMGAQKEYFAGHMDNIEIAEKVFNLLQK